ncbi:MAG: hypothetical protein PHW53_04730 [Patescibacteria group bacterium]|nr:hypothetical protein [Patescibacteria group bacterium]
MLKRLSVIALVAFIALLVSLTASDKGITGDGSRYSNSYVSSKAVDTTAARTTQTDSLVGTGLAPLFYFNDLFGATDVEGIFSCYISKLDTGSAANDYADTSKDSVVWYIYTAWNNPYRNYEKLICTLTFANPGVGVAKIQTRYFDFPDDSVLGDVIYGRLLMIMNDSDYTVARNAGKIYYTNAVVLNAR